MYRKCYSELNNSACSYVSILVYQRKSKLFWEAKTKPWWHQTSNERILSLWFIASTLIYWKTTALSTQTRLFERLIWQLLTLENPHMNWTQTRKPRANQPFKQLGMIWAMVSDLERYRFGMKVARMKTETTKISCRMGRKLWFYPRMHRIYFDYNTYFAILFVCLFSS